MTDKCKVSYDLKYSRTIGGLLTKIYAAQRYRSKLYKRSLPTYSKEELKTWILNQPNFNSLWNNWVASGYLTDLIPSVDRKDDYKSYTFDNIKLMTFKENREKYYKDVKSGVNRKVSKEICMLNYISNEFLKTYYSSHEASRQTSICQCSINAMINNRRQKYAKVNAGEFKGMRVYFKTIQT